MVLKSKLKFAPKITNWINSCAKHIKKGKHCEITSR
jgi:hypothetical protein